jgi:hypothetical protein
MFLEELYAGYVDMRASFFGGYFVTVGVSGLGKRPKSRRRDRMAGI